MRIDDRTEWLEADGLGGFASGTTCGIRTRRYHALLLAALTPPTGRVVLVNGFDAWVDTPNGSVALSTQRYAPDVLHPDGARRITAFARDPWPTWTFDLPDGSRLTQEIFVEHGTGTVVVHWSRSGGSAPAALRVRPFMSGRDYHSTHHENGAFRFEPRAVGRSLVFQPYDPATAVTFCCDGEYRHAPEWYRQFLYREERERGLDDTEDLASPGELQWQLTDANPCAVWIMRAGAVQDREAEPDIETIRAVADSIRRAERTRRASFPTELDRSADAYIVRRGAGRTIVAGYPWFTDWGRDTFIAMRGLCLATGRLDDAKDILIEWAGAVSEGMLPNRFPDHGDAPEFNSVDASLWYVVTVGEFLEQASDRLNASERGQLEHAIDAIVAGYSQGTRFGIRMDDDGLLAAGEPGVQLTWMDARVGDWVVTPRVGKPVEVQALWLNALAAASARDTRWQVVLARARRSFNERFWDERRGYLADVVDVDHVRGAVDDALRPNQILAVGGLPIALLDGERARRVVDAVAERLLTPIGLRSLAPGSTGYAARYEGAASARDAVYHQGTVWPWLLGPFVEAWLRVHGGDMAARREARQRFVEPWLSHIETAGLGHVSEIADAEAPFTPRGCPFQAWSLGEWLRVERLVLNRSNRRSRVREYAT